MNAPGQENQRTVTSLCANSCGFYGNPLTKNLCSKCYRDFIKLEEQKQSDMQLHHQPHQVIASDLSTTSKNIHSSSPLNSSKYNKVSNKSQSQPLINDGSSAKSISPYFPNNFSASVNSIQSNNDSTITPITNVLSEQLCTNTLELNNSVDANNLTSSLIIKPFQRQLPVSVNECSSVDKESNDCNQIDKTRCKSCNKKVGLVGFQCRCGFYFCGQHRHANSHDCVFDYKQYGRNQLSQTNQKVILDKINRI